MANLRWSSCLLAMMVLAAVGCGAHDPKPRQPPGERLPRLETITPTRIPFPVEIELSAMVEAMEKTDLCARVPGVVESLRMNERDADVDIGRRIKAGEPLFKLAIPELEAEKETKVALLEQAKNSILQADQAENVAVQEVSEAKAQVDRYRADVNFRDLQNKRVTALAQSNTVQAQLAEEAELQFRSAQAALKAAQAQVLTKEAKREAAKVEQQVAATRVKLAEAELKRLMAQVRFATIVAPFDGIVTRRWVNRGDTIKDPSVPLLTIMRADTVRVLLDIPERDVPLVNATLQNPNKDGKGDPVVLRIPALQQKEGGGEFPGHITLLASALDPQTRTMRAEVHLENKDGRLRPGMYGKATVLLEERYDVLTVPSTALVRRGDKVELFYVADAVGEPRRGIVRRVAVDLGLDDGRRVEIRGDLSGKDLIIAKGNGVQREGDTVIAVSAPVEP